MAIYIKYSLLNGNILTKNEDIGASNKSYSPLTWHWKIEIHDAVNASRASH